MRPSGLHEIDLREPEGMDGSCPLKNGDRPAGEKRIAERPRKKRQQEPLKDRKKAEKKKKKAGVHASARTTNGG